MFDAMVCIFVGLESALAAARAPTAVRAERMTVRLRAMDIVGCVLCSRSGEIG